MSSGLVQNKLYFFQSSRSVQELESIFDEYLADLDEEEGEPNFSIAIYSEHSVEAIKKLAQSQDFELLTEDEAARLYDWYRHDDETIEEYAERTRIA